MDDIGDTADGTTCTHLLEPSDQVTAVVFYHRRSLHKSVSPARQRPAGRNRVCGLPDGAPAINAGSLLETWLASEHDLDSDPGACFFKLGAIGTTGPGLEHGQVNSAVIRAKTC